MMQPLLPDSLDRSPDRELQKTYLFNRKRQAKIAFRLQRHQESEHVA